jgi:hypothetical protein
MQIRGKHSPSKNLIQIIKSLTPIIPFQSVRGESVQQPVANRGDELRGRPLEEAVRVLADRLERVQLEGAQVGGGRDRGAQDG